MKPFLLIQIYLNVQGKCFHVHLYYNSWVWAGGGSMRFGEVESPYLEFVVGGSLSSMWMAAKCIIDNQAMVCCMQ
jgi:hypothetical protein